MARLIRDDRSMADEGRDPLECWVIGVFSVAAVLIVAATFLHLSLSRTIVVLGPFSTLGLPAAVYLVASWCFAGGLVLLLGRGRSGGFGIGRGALAWSIVFGAAVVTNLLGQAAVSSAATPIFTHSAGSKGLVLLRLGDGIRSDSLAVYRGEGRAFELVGGTFPSPDVRSFAAGHRITIGSEGEEVVTYRGRDGRMVSVELPR